MLLEKIMTEEQLREVIASKVKNGFLLTDREYAYWILFMKEMEE